MVGKVAHSGPANVELGVDEEADGTGRVDTKPTETTPARHVTQADETSKIPGHTPLLDESGAQRQVRMPPEELHGAEAMRSEASKGGRETCVAPTKDTSVNNSPA